MGLSFLKTGAASAQIAQQDQVEAQRRREEQGKMYRFFLKDKEDAKITFIDGELSPEGYLVPPRYYEHNLLLNGIWGNVYVCPEKTMPDSGEKCPICASGDRPALVALFTIIDHRSFQNKDKTKTFSNQRRLLVCKSITFEILNKIAVKRGGLAGITFDVSRSGDKSPAVGSMFDFCEKTPIMELQAKYKQESVDPKTNVKKVETYFVPADYEQEITFRTSAELNQLGLGHPTNGYQMTPGGQSGATADYASQL